MDITPGNTFSCLIRASTGGKASTTAGGLMNAAPNNWVRVVRSGKTVTTYKSVNGTAWTKVQSTSLSMASSITIGLAVTSANTAVLNKGVFDQITVIP